MKPSTKISIQDLQARLDAAQGKVPCDVLIKDVDYLDVFSCEWRRGDVAIAGGAVVGVDPGLKAKRVIEGKHRKVVPGFIDAHVHLESSLLRASHFEKAVLPRGTTTAVCDPHELANVMGVSGIQYFLDASLRLKMDLRVMLSSCVPATHLETNGAGVISTEALLPLRAHPRALGLAEMMNVPGVLEKDPDVLQKLHHFSDGPMDGHCPLLTGQKLSAYIAAGITSCHESTQLKEAVEKVSKGMSVWIREGSVAKDLHAMIPLLSMARSTSLGFCTDDRNPLDIVSEGHLDYLVRESLKQGVNPEVAYRCASWTVARHYGLARKGAIAPGYDADLILLGDMETCSIDDVFCRGERVSELAPSVEATSLMENTVRANVPELGDLEAVKGPVHVIRVREGSILTEREVKDASSPGVAKLSVLERHGKGLKPANAYVTGFGQFFSGAIASSVGHDSHNLIAVGDTATDLRAAFAALIEMGGGFCVVRHGKVLARLALPFGGLMSDESPQVVEASLRKLHEASRHIGCELSEPFLQLAFLSLPVIPTLKLTDRGLVDVAKFQIIDVRAA